jgi:hypothetical protein
VHLSRSYVIWPEDPEAANQTRLVQVLSLLELWRLALTDQQVRHYAVKSRV